MLEYKQDTNNLLDGKIKEFISARPRYNNCFFPELDQVSYIETDNSLILKKKYESFNRIYFMSNDAEELVSILSSLDKDDIINIPSKKGIQEDLNTILTKEGYSLFATYERMYNNLVEPRGQFDAELANLADVEGIYQLLHNHFNPYTDTLPTREYISELIEKKWVLINRNEDTKEVEGTLLLRFEPQKCHYYIWVDSSNFTKALNLFINGFNYMNEKGYEKAYLWVRSTNVRPKKIYETLGFKYDGLKDYTYTKGDAHF